MRNHFVGKPVDLLKCDGSLVEPGWSTKQVWKYDKNAIKSNVFRIKEWDYYLVLAQDFGVAFTVSDLGFAGLHSVSFLDFKTPAETTKSEMPFFTMGKTNMPPTSSEGDVRFENKNLKLEYIKTEGQRRIVCTYKNFKDGKDFKCDISLDQPDMDSMVITIPWQKNKRCFYYNQKINCMRASGWVTIGDEKYEFNPATDFGTLDWGRGVWTYDNTWFWGSGNCDLDGHAFGFNIGYGFGDNSAATENILFYDGVAHKLDDIYFNMPENGSYTDPWTFSSSDGRFEMDFVPIIDRSAFIDFKAIISDQHQVFGRMSGKAILDDGTVLEIKDMLMFAEKVHNRY